MKYKNLTYKDLNNDQEQFIINNYNKMTYSQMALYLNVSKSTVAAHAMNLKDRGLIVDKKITRVKWTYEEENTLLKLIIDTSPQEIAHLLNKTYNAINSKIRSLRNKGKINKEYILHIAYDDSLHNTELSTWTQLEIDNLKQYIKRMSVHAISLKMKKGTYDVITHFHQLPHDAKQQLYYNCQDYNWEQQYDDFIVNNFLIKNKHEIMAAIPNRTWRSITRRAHLFGLYRMKNCSKFMPYTEVEIQKILNQFNIDYIHQYRIYYTTSSYFISDFYIPHIRTIIEVQGDYWHCNPKVFSCPNDIQKEKIQHDIFKKEQLEKLGYNIIYIWEYDIKNNYEKCINQIAALLP